MGAKSPARRQSDNYEPVFPCLEFYLRERHRGGAYKLASVEMRNDGPLQNPSPTKDGRSALRLVKSHPSLMSNATGFMLQALPLGPKLLHGVARITRWVCGRIRIQTYYYIHGHKKTSPLRPIDLSNSVYSRPSAGSFKRPREST